MAKLSFTLNKQRPNEFGRYPVVLRIVASGTNTSISCNIALAESAFVGNPDKVVAPTIANAKQINADLRETYYTFLNAIHALERSGRINAMSASDIRKYVESQKEFRSERTFTQTMLDYKDACRTDKTKLTFDYTLKVLKRFSGKEKLLFEEINYMFLTNIERWMEQEGIGMSSRGIVFRNMRAVYNNAINNDWVNQNMYPFRRFKIKQASKEKEYLHEDKFRKLVSLDLSGEQQRGLAMARDFFLLSFFLCGINPIDLYNMPKQDGAISFVRTKVKAHEPQPIHIGIQPAAAAIIANNPSDKWLAGFADKYVSFDSCYHHLKHRLKKLGEMIGEPGITFYWARYSWATYASELDVPDYIISKALGHADATLAQRKYISFDWSKVDKANQRVIDYAINGMRD